MATKGDPDGMSNGKDMIAMVSDINSYCKEQTITAETLATKKSAEIGVSRGFQFKTFKP